ncbi:AAA family ATPase [Streptomyces sp. 4F14]|uniref:AAA family ATPase n=1 Tax=Streptomyces sp. 4F14 TaxID=3394380 RepID=UPI003A876EFD
MYRTPRQLPELDAQTADEALIYRASTPLDAGPWQYRLYAIGPDGPEAAATERGKFLLVRIDENEAVHEVAGPRTLRHQQWGEQLLDRLWEALDNGELPVEDTDIDIEALAAVEQRIVGEAVSGPEPTQEQTTRPVRTAAPDSPDNPADDPERSVSDVPRSTGDFAPGDIVWHLDEDSVQDGEEEPLEAVFVRPSDESPDALLVQDTDADDEPYLIRLDMVVARERPTAPQAPEAVRFRPRGQDDLAPSGRVTRIRANISALRALHTLRDEQRPATPAEQAVLARWSSWGAVPEIFDPRKREFAGLRSELRSLLTEQEWYAAEATTRNAHFTDAALVEPIWQALKDLGFEEGRLLEPGCGSGNFLAFAPETAQMTGVELDPVTAEIAAALYPDAEVRAESFVDTRYPEGYFDGAIGNVPFDEVALTDPVHNPLRLPTHNHFIVKALEMVRPGGLVAVVTSRFTLDSMGKTSRLEISDRADLVGAVRLPAGAHRRAAGTNAVSDLLILRRRDGQAADTLPEWLGLAPVQVDAETKVLVNRYFAKHPERVLGTLSVTSTQYGREDITVRPDTGTPLAEALSDVLATITRQARESGLAMSASPDALQRAEVERRAERMRGAEEMFGEELSRFEGTLLDQNDGTFLQLVGGELTDRPVFRNSVEELRSLLGLRDTYVELLSAESSGDDERATTLRQQLNERYDAHAGQYGFLNRRDPRRDRRSAHGCFRTDPYAAGVYALEIYDREADTAKKSQIFTRAVSTPTPEQHSADTPHDALAISLNTYGEIRLHEISRLLGIDSLDETRDVLGELVYNEPGSQRLVPAAEYLSGNVRQKIEQVEMILRMVSDESRSRHPFQANLAALRRVLPPDKQPGDIEDIQFGATWVQPKFYELFLRQLLQTRYLSVIRTSGADWEIQTRPSVRKSRAATKVYGTARRNAVELAERLLRRASLVVHPPKLGEDASAESIVDAKRWAAEQTEQTIAKADEMSRLFADWLWQDPERSAECLADYNRLYNSYVPYEGDGSHLTFPGLSDVITPRPHQRAGVARALSEPGGSFFDYEVGFGKTLTIAMTLMEMKRLRMVNKPCVVVKNATVNDFRNDFLKAYPGARVLAIDSSEFTKETAAAYVAQIANGDWDAVILPQSLFKRIPMSGRGQEQFVADQTAEYRARIHQVLTGKEEVLPPGNNPGGDPLVAEALGTVAAISGVSGASPSRDTVKKLQGDLKRHTQRAEKNLVKQTATGISWEQTGIDFIAVDEVQDFANGEVGANNSELALAVSAQAKDLKVKIRTMEKAYGPKVALGSTGTPFPNAMPQSFVMFDYFRRDLLVAAEIEAFSSFQAQYLMDRISPEISPEGIPRMKERIGAFRNARSFHMLWKAMADVKTSAEIQLPVPKRISTTEVVDATHADREYMEEIADRAEVVRGGEIDAALDNLLKISNDGRLAAMDLRMVGRTPDGPGKIDAAADRIFQIHQAYKDRAYTDREGVPSALPGALQMVFADRGTPSDENRKAGKFIAYDYLKDLLVERGIPADQIRFAQEARNAEEKEALWAACRRGQVAVVIGSTDTMGVGVNIQDRAIALHHLDCPWRPSDVTQREGRIVRQFNQHFGQNVPVQILRWVKEGSFDSFMWQTVERKARFIDQVRTGRDLEEQDQALDGDLGKDYLEFGEIKAIATGNPLLLKKMQAEEEVRQLDAAFTNWKRTHQHLRNVVETGDETLAKAQENADLVGRAVQARTETKGDSFRMELPNGKTVTKRQNAAVALRTRLALMQRQMQGADTSAWEHVATLGGQEFHARINAFHDYLHVTIRGLGDIPQSTFTVSDVNAVLSDGKPPLGLVTRMENQAEKLDGLHTTLLAVVDELKQEIDRAQRLVGQPFTKADKLRRARADLAQLEAEIAVQAGSRPGEEPADDSSAGSRQQDNGAAEADELLQAFHDWSGTSIIATWRLVPDRPGGSAEDAQRRLVEAAGDALIQEIRQRRQTAQEGDTPGFYGLPQSQALLDAATAYLNVLATVSDDDLRDKAQEATRELIHGIRAYLTDAADHVPAGPDHPGAAEDSAPSAEPMPAQTRPGQEPQPAAGSPATVGAGPHRRIAEPYADRADYWSAEQSTLDTYRSWAEAFGSRLDDGSIQEQALARAAQQVLSESLQSRHSRLLGFRTFVKWETGQALAEAARAVGDQWDREQRGHQAVSRTSEMHAAVRDHFARYRATTEDPQSATFLQWARTQEPVSTDTEALEFVPGLSLFGEYTVTGPDGMRTEPASGADLAAGIAQLIADNVAVEETDGGLTLIAPNGLRFDISPSAEPVVEQGGADGPETLPGEEDPVLAQLIAHDMAAMAGGGWTEVVPHFGSQQEATDERHRVESAYERWAATQTALPMVVDAQEELAGEESGVTNPAGYVASWHHRSRLAFSTAGPTGGRMVVEQFEGLAQAARRADSHLAEEGSYASESDRALLLQLAHLAARYAQRLAATLDFLAEQRAQDTPTAARMHEVRALESAMEYLADQGAAFHMGKGRSSYTDREAVGALIRGELLDGFRKLAELPPEKQNLDADARVLYGHIRGIPLYVGWHSLGSPQAQAVLGFDQLSLLEQDAFTAAELEALTPSDLMDRIEGRLSLDALGAIRDRELAEIQALLVTDAQGHAAVSAETQTAQQPGAGIETSAEDEETPSPTVLEESDTPLHTSAGPEMSSKQVVQDTPGTSRVAAQNLAVLLGLYTDPGELVAGRELVRETVVQLLEAAHQQTDTVKGKGVASLVKDVSEAGDALAAAPQVSPAEIFPLYDRLALAASRLADGTDGDLAQKAHALVQRAERHLGRLHATGQDLFDVLLDASALDTGSLAVIARNDPLKERPAPYTDSSHLNFARQIIFETYDRWPQVYSSAGGEFSDRLRGAMWEIRQTSDRAVGTALPDWMNVVSFALAAVAEADEPASRSVLRDVAQRSYQHHQSLASFQLAAEQAQPYDNERSYTDGADAVSDAWDAWTATPTATYLVRREKTDTSLDAPQAHQLSAQEEIREALYAADWAQTDDGSLDEVTRRATKAAHTAYALVLSLGENSYRDRGDAGVLTRLVRTCYEHAAACRVTAGRPESVFAVRVQLSKRQDRLKAAWPDITPGASQTEPPAAQPSGTAALEIEHDYRGTFVRGVSDDAGDVSVRSALQRHDFVLSKDGTFWHLPRRMALTHRDVHVRKLIDNLSRLGRPHRMADASPDQEQPEITIPAGEPYTSKEEASQDFEEIFGALWRMQDTPAGRRLITRGQDARPDGAAVWIAMEELRQGPVGSNADPFVHPKDDIVSRSTELARAALTLARNLEEERYRAPVALPHFRTMTQYATLLASRVTATAAQDGLWEEVFATPAATPGRDGGAGTAVPGTGPAAAAEEKAPESADPSGARGAADLNGPGDAIDPLVAGHYGDEELRAAVDRLQHLYQQAVHILPDWHRPDVPPESSGDEEAWYRGPGRIEIPEGFVPYADDGAVLKTGDVIRKGYRRRLESKKLSYKTVRITGDRDPGDGYYRAAPGTRVHPGEVVAVPADSRLLTGAEEDRYTVRGAFWDRWKSAEVAADASSRGELPLPETIDAYRQAFIASGALSRILENTSVPEEAGILLERLRKETEHHIVRLTLTHRVTEEKAENEQHRRDQEREPQTDESTTVEHVTGSPEQAERPAQVSDTTAARPGHATDAGVVPQDGTTTSEPSEPSAVSEPRTAATSRNSSTADPPEQTGPDTRLTQQQLDGLPHHDGHPTDAGLAVLTTLAFRDGHVKDALLLLRSVEPGEMAGQAPIVLGAQIVAPNELVSTSLDGRYTPADLLAMPDSRVLPLTSPIPWTEVENLAGLPYEEALRRLPVTSADEGTRHQPPAPAPPSGTVPDDQEGPAQKQTSAAAAAVPGRPAAEGPRNADPSPPGLTDDAARLRELAGAFGDRVAIGHIGPGGPARAEEAAPAPAPEEPAPAPPSPADEQQEESMTGTEPETASEGPWTSRIKIVSDAIGTYVTGTTGAPEENALRDLLKRDRNFKYEKDKSRWRYNGMRGQKEQVLGEIRAFLAARDEQESAVVSAAAGKYPPTAQQQAIITAAVEGKNVAVQALAGTGKTSTLVMIAAQMPSRRIAYIAFNKAIADEAGRKFGRNVTARTSHSFAIQDLRNTPYRHKVSIAGPRNSGARRPRDVAAALGITAEIRVADGEGSLQRVGPEEIAKVVMGAIRRYRQSADAEIGRQHLGEKWAHGPVGRTLLGYARSAWADIADPNSNKIVFTHDDYLKIWALTNPRLPFDTIFFDEAQDINMVLKKVIQDQDGQVIVVGDSNQAIYEFRGAVDALKDWPADVVLPLTQSWRFGPAVAEVGNAFLGLLGSDLRLEGSPVLDTTLGSVEEPDAILTHTNVGAVSAVFAGFEAGKRVALVGGGEDIEDIARAARDLQQGRRTKHPELSAFENWNEVKEYAESDENAQTLQTFVRLVDRYTPQGLLNMIRDLVPEEARDEETRPELVVSTAHKSKGREWDQVQIWTDFPQPKEDSQTGELLLPPVDKIRLAYVAATRAKKRLDIGSLGWYQSLALLTDTPQSGNTPVPAPVQSAPAPAAAAARTPAVPEAPRSAEVTPPAAAPGEQPEHAATGSTDEKTTTPVSSPAAPAPADGAEDTAPTDAPPASQTEAVMEGSPEPVTPAFENSGGPPPGADQPSLFPGVEGDTPGDEPTAAPAAAQGTQPAPLPWDDQKIKKRGIAGIRRGQEKEIPNLARDLREALGDNQVRDVWERDNPWAQFEENLRHTQRELTPPDSALNTLVTEAAERLRTQIDLLAAEASGVFETLIQARAGDVDQLAELEAQLAEAHRLPELTDPLARQALILCLEAVDGIERAARRRKLRAGVARDALDQVMGLAGTSYSPDGQQLWPNIDAALAPVKVQVDKARERIAELSNPVLTEEYARLRALIASHGEKTAGPNGTEDTPVSAAATATATATANSAGAPGAPAEGQEHAPEPLGDRDIGAALSRMSSWDFGQLVFELDQKKRKTPQLYEAWFRLPSEPGYNEAGAEFASAFSSSGAVEIEIKAATDTAQAVRAGKLTLAKIIAWLRPALPPERRDLLAVAWRTKNAMSRSEQGFSVIGESGRWEEADKELQRILSDTHATVIKEALDAHLAGTAEQRVARIKAAEKWERDRTLMFDLGGPDESAADIAALERVAALRAVLPGRRNGACRLSEVAPGDCFTDVSDERLPFLVREQPVITYSGEVTLVGELVGGPGDLRPYTWETGGHPDDHVEPLLLPKSLAGLIDHPADTPRTPAFAPAPATARDPLPEANTRAGTAPETGPLSTAADSTAPPEGTSRTRGQQPGTPAPTGAGADTRARRLPYETQKAFLDDLWATENSYDAWAGSATGRALLSEARELQEETGVTEANEAARIQTATRRALLAADATHCVADAVLDGCRDLHTTVAEAGRSLAARTAFTSEEDRRLLLALHTRAQELLARLEATADPQALLDSEHDGARLLSRFKETRRPQPPGTDRPDTAPEPAQRPAQQPSPAPSVPNPQSAAAGGKGTGRGPAGPETATVSVGLPQEGNSPEAVPATGTAQTEVPSSGEPPADHDTFPGDTIGDGMGVNGGMTAGVRQEPDPDGSGRSRTSEQDEPVSAEDLAALEVDQEYEALIEEERMAEAASGTGAVPGQDDFDRHFEDIVALLRATEHMAQGPVPPPRPRLSAEDELRLREQYAATRRALSGILTSIDADPVLPTAEDPAVEAGDAAALAAAMSNAETEAGSYWGTPEWTMIRSISQAGQQLRGAVREALLTYAETTLRDIRAHGVNRTIDARTARAVSHGARRLAGRLERSGQRDSRAWRAVWGLHRAAATRADRLTGLLPAAQRIDLADQLGRAWHWFTERVTARRHDQADSTAGDGQDSRMRVMLANSVESIRRLYGAVSERLGDLAEHPVWRRISAVWAGARNAADKAKLGTGRFMADLQTLGIGRTLWVRTLEIISAGARTLTGRLAEKGRRGGLRWNLLRVLRHAAEDHIAHLHGHLPEGMSTPLGTYESAVDDAPENTPARGEETAPKQPAPEGRSPEGAGPTASDGSPAAAADRSRAVVLDVAAQEYTMAMDLRYSHRMPLAEAEALLARMEELGVVGPQDERGIRQVRVTPGEAADLLDAGPAAEDAAPRWQPVGDALTRAWFEEVRTAVRRDVRPGRGLSRRDLMNLLDQENARPGNRTAAGQRANECVDLFLQGRGDEVPQHLAGEGYVYDRGESKREGWTLRETLHSPTPAGGNPEAESEPEAAAGLVLPRRRRTTPADGPSKIERAAAGRQRQPSREEDNKATVTSNTFADQAQRMQARADFVRAAATSPGEERAADVLQTIAAKSRAASERIAVGAPAQGQPLSPQTGLTAEAFLAALRTTAQARGAQIPDDLLTSAMDAAREAVAAATQRPGGSTAAPRPTAKPVPRPTRKGAPRPTPKAVPRAFGKAQAEQEQAEHRPHGPGNAPGGVGRR